MTKKDNIQSRELPEVPGLTRKVNDSQKVERIYEDLDSVQRVSAGTSKEPIYTQVDLSKKIPKVPSTEEIAKQKAEELTKQYGPKVTVTSDDGTYAEVRRVGKPSEVEGIEQSKKSKELQSRELPKTPEINDGEGKVRKVNSEYEDIDALSQKSFRNVESEDPYSTIPEIQNPVKASGTEGIEQLKKNKELQLRELPEVPGVTRKVNEGQKAERIYEDLDSVQRISVESSKEPIYAQVDLSKKTPKVPSAEEIAKQKAEELTKQYGPKVTVTNDDGTYATVKRIGTVGEAAEETLTPRAASQRKNSGEEYERIPDSLKSGTEDSETGINSRRKRSTGEEESPYSTIKGELNSETEVIQPRSKKGGDSDYEELPDFILKNGTPGNEAGTEAETKVRRRRSLETEATDSSTSQLRPSNMEAPELPPRNSKNKDQVHVDELGRVIVPESQLDTISLGENTYRRQLENKLHSEAVDKLTITDTSVSNTNYVPKKLTEQERDAFFDKIRREAEKRDPHKEAVNKLKKIANDENNIPREALISKLNELRDGYSNEQVVALVNKSVQDGSKIVAPDTFDSKKLTVEERSEIGKVFNKTPLSDEYGQFRKDVDQKIFEKLKENPRFGELMNTELKGDQNKLRELFNIVSEAKNTSI
ncbi:hypothetical protein HMPREF9466_02541 [Fusobacterium necrophorum subsp. funduliforme 1_1_36S]|nr:hypothetical protein HMPREF9466_02541 [Fusobacterium necrophorum subsp. funduliforme 1_1_36S]